MDTIKKTLLVLTALLALLLGPTVVFLVKGNQVAAAITGTLTVCVILAISHVAVFGAGTWYTRSTMQMGADVALRAQENNDRWDVRQMETVGRAFTEGVRSSRQAVHAAPDMPPALPFPSQGLGDWLPEIAEFQTVDMR